MTPDDLVGSFLYGCSELDVNDHGIAPDMDPAHLATMGPLSVLTFRCVVAGDTPWELAVARLSTLTAALLVSSELGSGAEIVTKWLAARSEVYELWQLAGNK